MILALLTVAVAAFIAQAADQDLQVLHNVPRPTLHKPDISASASKAAIKTTYNVAPNTIIAALKSTTNTMTPTTLRTTAAPTTTAALTTTTTNVTPTTTVAPTTTSIPTTTISTTTSNVTMWHIIWVGGQSNSVGTNSQKPGQYPTWPTTDRIRMYCANDDWPNTCETGKFDPAQVPVHGEVNVGFSQTFANLLLPELPDDHGIILLNTGVGGTGFITKEWVVPDGRLTKRSIAAMDRLVSDLPYNLGGNYQFHAMLWHQGEDDAGDNSQGYSSSYCNYLINDMSAIVDHFRATFKGASAATPFIDGGLLPYWIDKARVTDVMSAIYSLNTSRPCTATADSLIFKEYIQGTHIPNGDPSDRSGISGDVIHFNATEAIRMGYQYFDAYKRAVMLNTVVPSIATRMCGGSSPLPVTECTGASFSGGAKVFV